MLFWLFFLPAGYVLSCCNDGGVGLLHRSVIQLYDLSTRKKVSLTVNVRPPRLTTLPPPLKIVRMSSDSEYLYTHEYEERPPVHLHLSLTKVAVLMAARSCILYVFI